MGNVLETFFSLMLVTHCHYYDTIIFCSSLASTTGHRVLQPWTGSDCCQGRGTTQGHTGRHGVATVSG